MINVKQYDLDKRHIDIVGVFEFDKKKKDESTHHIGESEKSKNREKWSELSQEKKDELNKIRSILRTKSKVRRLVISQNMRYMWTLTFRDKLNKNSKGVMKDSGDLSDVWEMWSAFLKRCKRAGVEFKYIVTVEVQEKRRQKHNELVYHFHFVTDKALAINEKKAKQMKVGYNIQDLWGHGFVFVSSSVRGKSFAARYITKYITKMIEETKKSSHRYRCSLGMVVPTQEKRFQNELELDIYAKELAEKHNLMLRKEYFALMDGDIEVLVYILCPKYKPKIKAG